MTNDHLTDLLQLARLGLKSCVERLDVKSMTAAAAAIAAGEAQISDSQVKPPDEKAAES